MSQLILPRGSRKELAWFLKLGTSRIALATADYQRARKAHQEKLQREANLERAHQFNKARTL